MAPQGITAEKLTPHAGAVLHGKLVDREALAEALREHFGTDWLSNGDVTGGLIFAF